MHADNFLFTPRRHKSYVLISKIVSTPPIHRLFRFVGLNRHVLRSAYARTHNAKVKFAQAAGNQALFDAMMDMEIKLWHSNDVRTHFQTTVEMLTVNNCDIQIDLPVWHAYTDNDNYFDNSVVEQQMQVVFREYFPAKINSKAHAPSVIANKKESRVLIPPELRDHLKPPKPKKPTNK